MDDILDEIFPPLVQMPLATLSIEDQKVARKICDLCFNLWLEVKELRTAIFLFDHTLDLSNKITGETIRAISSPLPRIIETKQNTWNSIIHGWPTIAAREVLSVMYNFEWSLNELNSDDSLDLFKKIDFDTTDIEKAREDFAKKFPKIKFSRHASAHRSEIVSNPIKNAFRGKRTKGPVAQSKGSSMIVSEQLSGRTFYNTRKGELLEFDITWDNYKFVLKIYNNIASSLSKITPTQQ